MRKTLFLAALLLSLTAIAAPVSQTDALNAANAFMSKHRSGVSFKSTPVNTHRLMTGRQTATQPSFYIFNTIGDQGYVIASGDDRTTPILGYVDHGNFDPNNMPANMKIKLPSGRTETVGAGRHVYTEEA